MTWQSKIMPDDALSNSLVGVMLNGEAEAAPVPVAEPNFRAILQRLIDAEGDLVRPYDECGPAWHLLVSEARAALEAQPAAPAPRPRVRPEDEYHEDMGAVLWWRFPIDEPPYCGSPLDSDWPGYHTHFISLEPLPELPTPPEAQP
jgi:hypothetical protein